MSKRNRFGRHSWLQNTRVLLRGKAVPRDWLVQGQAPITVENMTTRYGRISFGLGAVAGGGGGGAGYAVRGNVTLPASFAARPPPGGVRLRIRTPMEHAGKLSKVTVGGKAWPSFTAAEETIDIPASQLTAALIRDLADIVATF